MPGVEMPNEYIGSGVLRVLWAGRLQREPPTVGTRETRCDATLRRGLVSALRRLLPSRGFVHLLAVSFVSAAGYCSRVAPS